MDNVENTPNEAVEITTESNESPAEVIPVTPAVVGDPLLEAAVANVKPFQIEVEYRERVCYALAYNKVPTVRSIGVRNQNGGVSGQLTVEVSMKWSASDIQPMRKFEVVLDTPAVGQKVIVDGQQFRLDDTALVDLTESAPAQLVVTVRDQTGVEQTEIKEVLVLPRDQWINDRSFYEITSAFVQPNHPAVTQILQDASSILMRDTQSSSLEGYQSGPERAAQIGQAIFMALQARIDRYIDPPASFEEEGQKLRPLDRVLEERQGTCLDLACAYASCLEQAGLNPLVFMVHGHAFTGFYLQEIDRGLPASITDFNTSITLLESGLIIAAETTLLTEKKSFAEAVAAVRRHMRDSDLSCGTCAAVVANGMAPQAHPHLRGLVNVSAAHQSGILPLPARVVRDGIVTLVIDNGPTQPPIIERRDEKTRKLLPNTVPARVQQWKNSLLDLSFRNTLLNFKPEKTGIKLLAPPLELGKIEDWLSSGQPIVARAADFIDRIYEERGIRAAQDIGQEELALIWNRERFLFAANEEATFVSRVRGLISKSKLEEQDSGVNNLYITFGSLIWNDPKSATGEVRSPIFMAPIRMAVKRGQVMPVIMMDETATTNINYCLIEALRARTGMKLQWFSDDMSDDFGIDVERGLQEMRSEILDQRLTEQGFRVETDISIGMLRFNKVRLWKDLNDHWMQFMANPVVSHLVEGGRQQFVDPKNPEGKELDLVLDSELLNPTAADGAQSIAIKRALSDQSFVLEGPPGTGKSQTITNLLANALAKGKRVLFVAEKQAALSVVKERLASVGLDPFCLDLHDKGSRPDDIKNQLRDALDFVPQADMVKWQQIDSAFDVAARALAVYRQKVHGAHSSGASYYDAYSRFLELGEGVVGDISRKIFDVDSDSISGYQAILGGLEEYSSVAQPQAQHPYMLAGNVVFDLIDRAAFAQAVKNVSEGLNAITGPTDQWTQLCASATTPDELRGLVGILEVVLQGVSPSQEQWREVVRPGWIDDVRSRFSLLTQVFTSIADVTNAVGTRFLTSDLASRVAEVKVASESFALGRRGKVRKALGDLEQFPMFGEAEPLDAVRLITRLHDAGVAYRAAMEGIKGIKGLVLPDGFAPLSNEDLTVATERIDLIEGVIPFLTSGGSLADQAVALAGGISAPPASLQGDCRKLADGIDQLWTILQPTTESIARWQGTDSFFVAVRRSLDAMWLTDVENGTYRFIQRWLAFAGQVEKLQHESLQNFRTQLYVGEILGRDALGAFDRALMGATLTVVGESNDLDVFDHASHNRRISEFIALLSEREKMLRAVIPYMLVDARQFSASSKTGAVGQLRQELGSKKRGARSVRGLIAKYPDLIASLTPCFLMSPDSIAKFLEPGTMGFDLVLFDEASQIPVSSAVGALGRSTAAVIVGDSRQMPPTMIGVASGDTPEDEVGTRPDTEEPALISDAESILDECLESGMDQEWLAWHYRSQDELLIKFSNDKYYDGRLSSFPSPFSSVPGCGISYIRVNGQFDHGGKRTNDIEADAIVAEVKRRAHDPLLRKSSIGIVTLNNEQRQLVAAKLAAANDPAITALLENEDDQENLFVLNLESVQGRERDVIILGTSFSKRIGGGKMPLNFGPLTAAGGERRLNVAITRGRREVVVISSFEPEEMADAKSLGMVHLYEYLQLARAAAGGSRPESNVPSPVADDLHRTLVADKLRERGLIVRVGHGLSSFKVDLAVTLPGYEDRWLVGILLDGKVWASRPLALDRDALPVNVLQNMMGWKRIARIWLPSWRKDSSELVEDIFDLATAVSLEPEAAEPVEEVIDIAEVVESTVAPTDAPPPPPPASSSGEGAWLPGQQAYVPPSQISGAGTVVELEAISPNAREVLNRFVEESGPMPLERAVKLTATAFGLTVVRDAKLKILTRLVDPDRTVFTEFGTFVYPMSTIETGQVLDSFTWFRKSTSSERRVQDISPHELANLFVALVRSGFSMSREELAQETLAFLGYSRKTADTTDFVHRVIEWAVDNEYLIDADDRLSVS
jgi:hypothetical protein